MSFFTFDSNYKDKYNKGTVVIVDFSNIILSVKLRYFPFHLAKFPSNLPKSCIPKVTPLYDYSLKGGDLSM